MIRRDAGHDFLLISQIDHAAVAAALARHFGNAKFTRASPVAVTAASLHDAGWPLHDDEPALNQKQHPLDVFETPRDIALKVWAASADRAESVDPYAGLLVSLHSLSLSIHANAGINTADKFDVQKMHDQFAVNKFQHREIERQEQLRARLDFNPNVLVRHGLADAKASVKDDQLRFDFRLLQAMDLLSLCLCCTKPPQEKTNDVLKNPDAAPIQLHISKSLDGTVHVEPWPFDQRRIELTIPCKRVPAKQFASPEELREVYASAKASPLELAIAL